MFIKSHNFGWKKGSKKLFKKRVPPHWQTTPYSNAGRLLEKQPRVRAFWTRNNCLGKKQQQLLISESISEPLSWNGLFLESMSGKLLTFWWNLKQKREVIAEVFAHCTFSKGWWSDTLWAKARRISHKETLVFRQIWDGGECFAPHPHFAYQNEVLQFQEVQQWLVEQIINSL